MSADHEARLIRIETKLDYLLMGLPEKVAQLEQDRARWLGWAGALSFVVSLVAALAMRLLFK